MHELLIRGFLLSSLSTVVNANDEFVNQRLVGCINLLMNTSQKEYTFIENHEFFCYNFNYISRYERESS